MSNQVELISLQEKRFVGIPVTSPFQDHQPERIDETRQIFLGRRHEIKAIVNPQEYVCPHFTSEVLFTYFFCMEVSEISDVPSGMIGFTLPAHLYAQTRSDLDPYEVIHSFLRDISMESNSRALAFEVYGFDNPQWPSQVDVYVPVKE
ncbi:GyrI-like domain-containing protein [Cohnella sp.]|uniref:GyrI-like domain-containing protein n=1 Tax=Cohnella sp. TaxID=1883426 RepID=UPI00356509EE